MNTGAISKRYAKALLQLTGETGKGEQVYAQALEMLEHPDRVPQPLEEDLQKLVVLLQRNGRLPYVKFILRSFVDQYRAQHGLVYATLTTAVPAPELEQKLREALGDTAGSMYFTTKVDPDLIGGFVLEVDEKVLDASAKNQIERIRHQLDELNKRIV